jgi:hypothetical protein
MRASTPSELGATSTRARYRFTARASPTAAHRLNHPAESSCCQLTRPDLAAALSPRAPHVTRRHQDRAARRGGSENVADQAQQPIDEAVVMVTVVVMTVTTAALTVTVGIRDTSRSEGGDGGDRHHGGDTTSAGHGLLLQ